MASYCGVPKAVGELYNYSPAFQGVPLGDFANRDPRVPSVPTNRSWVSQGDSDDDEQRAAASDYDLNADSVQAPESDPLRFVRAIRGPNTQLNEPAYIGFNRDVRAETERIHNSLGREMLNGWHDARFNVGGIGYAYDNTSPTGIHWASSPGYKGDAFDPKFNPQIYMRPGVKLAAGFSSIGAVPPGQLPGRQ